ncbi:unnamed protein product [Hermetia illucens]|uniref:Uncharacterized protein n=1 Tax=Hermetia illucens TaxID=343691 RepID=A0A7R8YM01_HERIL|nr:unnamed protein product [Hermetia illucens]
MYAANTQKAYTFGISTKSDRYSGEELIYNRDTYDMKTRIHGNIAYLSGVRLKKRFEADEMNSQFIGRLDPKNCLCIMKDHFLEVEEDKIRFLLDHFITLQNIDNDQFKQIMNPLDCKHPGIGRLDDVFVPDVPALTTYRNF